MNKILCYILLAAVTLSISGCGTNGNSQNYCKKLGYNGVVLWDTLGKPPRYCSDGLTQGNYFITSAGLYPISDYSYFELVVPTVSHP